MSAACDLASYPSAPKVLVGAEDTWSSQSPDTTKASSMKVVGRGEAKMGPERGTKEKRRREAGWKVLEPQPRAGANGEAKNAEQWALGLAHPGDMGVAWE